MRVKRDRQMVPVVSLEEEFSESYVQYAMSVIVGRAIPDMRDGLKPVQLRILYGMKEMGMYPNRPRQKTAKVVGEVMGNYHPHGDEPIYLTLVRMAQDFSYRYPLIDGQGNFGSIDGDPPAQMRYPECRLSPIAMELLEELDEETVDFRPNYDGSRREPIWLPARIPNLLMNGSTGIAVGVATSIPPHRLNELVDAFVHLLHTPDLSVPEIMRYLPGPDFPTGGEIVGRSAIEKMYATGRGNIKIRAKMILVQDKKHPRLEITEIPYGVKKSDIVAQIASLVREKRVEGIRDLRDESDYRGIKIVVELSDDCDPEYIRHYLLQHTSLETTFNAVFLVLDNGVPKLMNLKDLMMGFLNHRRTTVRRRTQFRLKQAEKRAHILNGLMIALEHLDEVINLVRNSPSPKEAQAGLMERYSLSEAQAQAILEIRLSTLTSLEREKVKSDLEKENQEIKKWKKVLAHPEEIDRIVEEELKEIARKYGDERRTAIREEEEKREFVIPQEWVVVTWTKRGYVKRVALSDYRAYGRGSKGLIGAELTFGDEVAGVCTAFLPEAIYAFSSKGKIYSEKAFSLPAGDRYSRGRPISNLFPLAPEEEIVFFAVPGDRAKKYLILATSAGSVKRILFPALVPLKKSGKKIIRLAGDESLVSAVWANEEDFVMLTTRKGRAVCFPVSRIRAMGRASGGVRGIRLESGDAVISALLVAPESYVLFVTEKGFGKRVPVSQVRSFKHRGGKGVRVYKVSAKTGDVVYALLSSEEKEIFAVTAKGKIVRQAIDLVSVQSRYTRGIRLITVENDDVVRYCALL
ncbi:MAG: DNA gyrase subunit A [bacterium JZ-2024 1]